MTEDDARDWLRDTFGAVCFAKLETFVALLLAEATRQSLIARSTFDQVWARHIADSAQLALLAGPNGTWVDVGSGGGLPGIVIAIIRDAPMVMVEPRRKRVAFLEDAVSALDLVNARVIQGNVQRLDEPAWVISARAVASLDEIFTWTRQIVSRETQYLLQRGQNATSDLDIARRAWHGSFHVEQSLTDPHAGIVLATGVRPK